MKRSELFGFTGFMANCGGLLGLFMGISVLSIIEIIYHFTLRLGCSIHLRRNQQSENMGAHEINECSSNTKVLTCANTLISERTSSFNTTSLS